MSTRYRIQNIPYYDIPICVLCYGYQLILYTRMAYSLVLAIEWHCFTFFMLFAYYFLRSNSGACNSRNDALEETHILMKKISLNCSYSWHKYTKLYSVRFIRIVARIHQQKKTIPRQIKNQKRKTSMLYTERGGLEREESWAIDIIRLSIHLIIMNLFSYLIS